MLLNTSIPHNIKRSEKSAIKSIKMRCKRFMEEDEERSARNSTLMKMLERIDYQAATLAAKTERLKLLKVSRLKCIKFKSFNLIYLLMLRANNFSTYINIHTFNI